MAINFRTLFPFLVPSWLSSGDGGKVLQALALLKDAYAQWARDALEARMPSRAGDSALALIGADRGIPRGRSETAAHYATRLIRWRYPRGHRTRGSAFALLEQVSEYFGGMPCWTIDIKGTIHNRDAAGVETFSYGNAWNWDGTTTPVYRFWIVLQPVNFMPGIARWPAVLGAWGNSLVPGRGLTVGQQGISPDDCAAIRGLFKGRQWKPAGTMQQYAVIMFGTNPPSPTGNWDRSAHRVGVYRFLRLS